MTDLKQLFSDLVRLEIELYDALDRRLRDDFGLPLSRFELMQVIARTEACRVYDIVSRLSITVGGVSKAVDRMEA
jgi:DNA-binding MarR family transcriptional regulator